MYRWYGLADVPSGWGECVATIGVFDGVHRGHQRIIGRAEQIARSRSLPVVVITFDPHPDEVVRPGSHPPDLTSPRRLAELLAGLGADALCVLPFTVEFSRLSPDEFVRMVLSERLHAAAVVVGENFRFGHKAAGDVPLLVKLGEKYDFTAEGVPLLVADGVYAGWLTSLALDGSEVSRWPAAISVGTNPTFGIGDRTVEAHALDRDDLDLYGTHAAIDFAARLRATKRFDSVEALVTQMREDVIQARTRTAG